MKKYIRIHEKDNVAVAIREIAAGETIEIGGLQVRAQEEIPAGHKIALGEIPAGGEVIKYGCRIGNAKAEIPAGCWVHTHNLGTALGELLTYEYEPVGQAHAEQQEQTELRMLLSWVMYGRTGPWVCAMKSGSFPP